MVAYVPPKQAGKYKAVASGAITNGKPVLVNSTGTVSEVAESSSVVGSAVTYENAHARSFTISSAFDSNSNKVVIAYRDNDNSGYGTAVVGTVDSSDNSISFGTPVVFNSGALTDYVPTGMAFDSSNNKIVIAYADNSDSDKGKAIVGTVSGTSISFGSEAEFEAGSTNSICATFDSSNNKVVIAYQDADNSKYGTAIVGTVSSTSISFGTAVVFESATADHTKATFDSNSNKVVIAYRDRGNSNYGTAIVGTVSSTAISFGTAVVMEETHSYNLEPVFDSSNNKVVISYLDYGSGNPTTGNAIVGTVSGTSISFGSVVEWKTSAHSSDNRTVFDPSVNKVVIAHLVSNQGTFSIGTVSGTSISFGTDFTYTTISSGGSTPVFDSNSNRVVVPFSDGGAGVGNLGKAVVAQIGSSNITSEGYIGIASGGTYADTAEATIDVVGTVNKDQTSLTAGQTYYVQNDGTLGTSAGSPSVVAGTAISATEIIVKG